MLLFVLSSRTSSISLVYHPSFPAQACWNPDIAHTDPYKRIPTPDDEVEEPVTSNDVGFADYHFRNILVTPTRSSPLPNLW